MKPQLLNIDDPETTSGAGLALFSLGFRPFFLLAGLTAALLVPLWVYAYAQGEPGFGYYGTAYWHGHEMLFGYTVAVIAGFLLTAVRNWTGRPTPGGKALAGLVLLWLAGRAGPLGAALTPPWVIAALDAAFLPVLALVLAVPLLRSRQRHNLVFLVILAALTTANVLLHLQLLGLAQATARAGLDLALYTILLLIVILGGRVIPFFTEKGIAGASTRRWRPVEVLAAGSLLVLLALELVHAPPYAVSVIALLAALAHGIRLAGWYHERVWSVPLLWVLHLGYAWLVAGFLCRALTGAGLLSPTLALHAFTAGAIGTLTLGMMARVALGHTGRALQVGPAMSGAFVLANLGALLRVVPPAFSPEHYTLWLSAAATAWSTAFALFVVSYAGILLRPRIDGRPG